jgi:hypothetical protein
MASVADDERVPQSFKGTRKRLKETVVSQGSKVPVGLLQQVSIPADIKPGGDAGDDVQTLIGNLFSPSFSFPIFRRLECSVVLAAGF